MVEIEGKGRGLSVRHDRRSRLDDVPDSLLRITSDARCDGTTAGGIASDDASDCGLGPRGHWPREFPGIRPEAVMWNLPAPMEPAGARRASQLAGGKGA